MLLIKSAHRTMVETSLSTGAKVPLPKALKSFLDPLILKAYQMEIPVYLVGGLVRDLLLKRPSHDVDVVMEGPSDRLAKAAAKLYGAKLIAHPQFLTFTLSLKNGRHLDIATARTETYLEPATLPVVEPASLQDDLYRRDFSINAMAISLNPNDFGHLWDPFGGLEDLRAGKIRVLHADSFKDDPTRIYRAARFAGRFGFELDWRTREWMQECIAQQIPSKVSGARLREELVPILMEHHPSACLDALHQWTALADLVPAVHWDKPLHRLMTVLAKDHPAGKPTALPVRLMALLYSVPVSKAMGLMANMMFPQSLIQEVEAGIGLLSDLREGKLSPSRKPPRQGLSTAVTAFVAKAAKHRCSSAGTAKQQDPWSRYQDCAPCLSGQDLRDLGFTPGPVFTKIFESIREARWEGKLRTREEEIRFVKSRFSAHV